MMRVDDLKALLREWLHRVIGTLLRRRRSDGDLAREIAFHLEQAELHLRSRGYSLTEVDLAPFILSGGASYCMTLRLDRTSVPAAQLHAAE